MKLKSKKFTRKERLATTLDFERLKRKNHLYFNQGPIKVYILKQSLEYSRLGIIVYKKAGKAFFRNKIKRWVREIFRASKNDYDFQEKIDIVFAIGRGTHIVNRQLLQEAYLAALRNYQETGY